MVERVRAFDWSLTPLGPIDSWPASLRSTADMLLACSIPMIALWGPDLVQIYNEGYSRIMAAKHPGGLGKPTRECWPEVWEFNLPIYERVRKGETVTLENQLFPITRQGYLEDAYFTLCYSPLWDEAGSIAGVLVTVFEITERLRAENKLRESEANYRRLFEEMSEGYCLGEILRDETGQAIDWRYILMNPALEKHTGMNVEASTGRWFNELFPDVDQSYWLGVFQEVVDTQTPKSFEDYWPPTERWLRGTASPASNGRYTVFYQDVTERKRNELALRESEERQAFLLKLSDALRPLADTAEIQSETTRLLGEHLGLDRCYYFETDHQTGDYIIHREFKRGDLRSLVGRHPIQQWPQMTAALSRGEMLVVHDYADSSDIPPGERPPTANLNIGAIIVVPLVKHGRLVACMSAIQALPRNWKSEQVSLVADVAERTWAAVERSRAESALRESEERARAESALRERGEHLRALTVATNSLLYEMSADWAVMYRLDRNGFPADTQIAEPDWLNRYIHPLDQTMVQEAIQAAIRNKSVFELEHRTLLVNGSTGWTFSRAIPILAENGEIRRWFGAARDISDRKLMEAALRQREKLAAVGQMASTIAHEINNPLESITNLIYLARSEAQSPTVVEYLEGAEIELRRVAAIANHTLRFHKQPTKLAQASAEKLITTALSTYQGRIRNSAVQIESRFRATGFFRCLDGEIQQVLNNLIGNAVDAMKAQGGRLLVRSANTFDRVTGQPFIRITVADSGTGIPREIIKDIFQPFFTTKDIAGTGLGLWISKEIVDHHKGRLRVRSSIRAGRTGTVFTLLLPR